MDWLEALAMGICLGNKKILDDLRKWAAENACEPFDSRHSPGVVWRAIVADKLKEGMDQVGLTMLLNEGAWQAVMRVVKERAASRKQRRLAEELRVLANLPADEFKKAALEKFK